MLKSLLAKIGKQEELKIGSCKFIVKTLTVTENWAVQVNRYEHEEYLSSISISCLVENVFWGECALLDSAVDVAWI